MHKYVVILWVMLLVVPYSMAAEEVLTGQEAANRFLSAEVTRQMQQSEQSIIEAVNQYNDENFMAFDGRMASVMTEIRIKYLLAAIGASLISAGICTLVILRVVKNNSYERYLEKLVGNYEKQESAKRDAKGMEELQQEQWNQPKPNNPDLGQSLGPAAMAVASSMNQWQQQPAHDTAWRPPDVQQEYRPIVPQYRSPNDQDPMDVGWNREAMNYDTNPEDPLDTGWDAQRGY